MVCFQLLWSWVRDLIVGVVGEADLFVIVSQCGYAACCPNAARVDKANENRNMRTEALRMEAPRETELEPVTDMDSPAIGGLLQFFTGERFVRCL